VPYRGDRRLEPGLAQRDRVKALDDHGAVLLRDRRAPRSSP
jgi:hypothetical protein